jgi:hypothetical protein
MFNRSRSGKCRVRPHPRLVLEELESRTLLSASALDTLVAMPLLVAPQASIFEAPQGHGHGGGGGGGGGTTNPPGYSPSQIRTAYGFANITGDGSGQTIAIVDAYNDPNVQSDLAAFDRQFALPTASLTVVNQSGGTTLPKTNSGWSLEISLDVEWAHAMAPGAKIVLVEANTNSLSNLMTAVNTAASWTGVSVVSMSWGGSEFSSETGYDSYFLPYNATTNPNGYTNNPYVTFVAAAGDSGAPPIWPAVSPNVVAVGGTDLYLNSDNTWASETAWSSGGGGISAYESQPSYQSSLTQYTKRTNPDVAYNADPSTGYAVYDTVPYYGQTGWFEVGGTSAGAPQWSALVAIADQGRGSQGPLASSGTLNALYQMLNSSSYSTPNTGYFHDITSGSNNDYSAGTGYDLVTGIGSPQAQNVVSYLLGVSATVTPLTTALSTSGSTTTSASLKASLVDASTGSVSSSSFASFMGQVLAATDAAILNQAAQTNTAAVSPFSSASLASLAFGAGQAPSAPGGIVTSQAALPPAAVPSWQVYAPGPNSVSTPSAAFHAFSEVPAFSEAVDGLPTADFHTPNPIIPALEQGEVDLVPPLPLGVPAGTQPGEMSSVDVFFADETALALLAAESMAPANDDAPESPALRGFELALLGLFAGSLWRGPATAEERRARPPLALEA